MTAMGDILEAADGEKIRTFREMRRWSQDDLGAKTGMSRVQISRLERSKAVKDAVLEKVCAALGITVEYFKEFDESALFKGVTNNFHDCTFGQQTSVSPGRDNNVYNSANLEDVFQIIEASLERIQNRLIEELTKKK